jgi:hypothetical protein
MVGWDDLSGVEREVATEFVTNGLKLMVADATDQHAEHLLTHHKDDLAKFVRGFTEKLCNHRLSQTEIPPVGSQTVEEFWSGAPAHVRAALAHGTLNEVSDHGFKELPDYMQGNIKSQIDNLRADEAGSESQTKRFPKGFGVKYETPNPIRRELEALHANVGRIHVSTDKVLDTYENILQRLESPEYKQPLSTVLEGVGVDLEEVESVVSKALDTGVIQINVGDRIEITKDLNWADYQNVEHFIHEGSKGTIVKIGPIQVPGKMDYEVKLGRPVKGTEIVFVEPGEFKLLDVKK